MKVRLRSLSLCLLPLGLLTACASTKEQLAPPGPATEQQEQLFPEPDETMSEPAPEVSFTRPGFTTRVSGDSEVLWVFRDGSPGAQAASEDNEPEPSVSMIGAGPGGITLRGPDEETLIAYLRAEDFHTQIQELEGGQRALWVYRQGTPEAEAARAGQAPTQFVSWPGAGPDGLQLNSPHLETLLAYTNADAFYTRVEDLGDEWKVLWVFRSGSREAERSRIGDPPAKYVTLVGAGIDGENVCSPDRATALEYLSQRAGFHTQAQDLTASTMILWVFVEDSLEAKAAQAGMLPNKSVSRIGAGPDGVTLRAPDTETLEAFLQLL